MLKRFIALALASTVLALAAMFYARAGAVQTGAEVDGSSLTLSGRAAAAAAQGELTINHTTRSGHVRHPDNQPDACC